MYGGIRMTTSANASSRPWMSSTVIVARPRRARPQGVDERSSSTPRDALTRTTSPSRSRGRRRVERGVGIGRPVMDAVGSSPAAARAVGDARRRPARRRPAGRRSGRRGLADRAVALVVAVAELEHLAEDRDAPAGQPGEQVERGDDRAGRRVVGVVDDGHAAADGRARTRCGADQPPARPATISSRSARREPDGGRASALWTDSRPSAGIVDVAAAASVSRRPKRMPVEPGDVDGLGADVGVVARSRRSGRGPPSARAHPADDRVVGVEDRPRRPAAAPRPARPWPARSPRASRCATGGPAGPRSPRRSPAARCAPGRRSRRRRTCPSRGRRPRAPGRGAGRSAAARSRCSGCPRCAASGSAGRGPPRPPPWSTSWRCSR